MSVKKKKDERTWPEFAAWMRRSTPTKHSLIQQLVEHIHHRDLSKIIIEYLPFNGQIPDDCVKQLLGRFQPTLRYHSPNFHQGRGNHRATCWYSKPHDEIFLHAYPNQISFPKLIKELQDVSFAHIHGGGQRHIIPPQQNPQKGRGVLVCVLGRWRQKPCLVRCQILAGSSHTDVEVFRPSTDYMNSIFRRAQALSFNRYWFSHGD